MWFLLRLLTPYGFMGLIDYLKRISNTKNYLKILNAIYLSIRTVFAVDELQDFLSYHRAREIKKGSSEGTMPCIQRVSPSLDADKFSFENAISPTKNKTNIIDNMLSFKDINMKLVFAVLTFINLVYGK